MVDFTNTQLAIIMAASSDLQHMEIHMYYHRYRYQVHVIGFYT